jgi:hypothetical protein
MNGPPWPPFTWGRSVAVCDRLRPLTEEWGEVESNPGFSSIDTGDVLLVCLGPLEFAFSHEDAEQTV